MREEYIMQIHLRTRYKYYNKVNTIKFSESCFRSVMWEIVIVKKREQFSFDK